MDVPTLALFFVAALAIAISPGPGMLYVAARTLSGGRGEGLASSFGTGLGGLFHVAAGAIGVSALVMASAEAFTILKLAGALYLVWIGIKTIRDTRLPLEVKVASTGASKAFREGIVVEALNPKTAAFFLAFLPQFVDPSTGPVWLQFLLLGLISMRLTPSSMSSSQCWRRRPVRWPWRDRRCCAACAPVPVASSRASVLRCSSPVAQSRLNYPRRSRRRASSRRRRRGSCAGSRRW